MQQSMSHSAAGKPISRARRQVAASWFPFAFAWLAIACASLLLGCSSQPHDTTESATTTREQLAAAPNLPDLVITAVTVSPANVAPGQPATFSATVKNQGGAATPAGVIIGVQFDVDGTEVSWSDNDTQSLAPGASVILTANSGPSGGSTWMATAGFHTIQGWVDDVNRIAESDETNNKLSGSLSIGIDLTLTAIARPPPNTPTRTPL